MMEQEKLRKADIFSGSLIVLLGIFIISQALRMPMKDSWGGVQNVWFVSPALFPLLVGGMLTFLGSVLITIAFRAAGKDGLQSVFSFLMGSELLQFLRHPQIVRFYAIVFNLIAFVFLMVPYIDFFLAAIYFLLVSFVMFYFGDHGHLLKIFRFTVCSSLILFFFLAFGIDENFAGITEFSADWLVIFSLLALWLVAGTSVRGQQELNRKYRLSLILALVAPLTIGIIFKYFLYVPMPHEGLIVQLLDSIWYAELWS
ncbi:MAG: hypothetical protein WBB19_06830 [Desulforhopalus sp.]